MATHALAVARERQAKSWELHADKHGAAVAGLVKRQQTHDPLAPICGWFSRGFDTLDLKPAKTLLDELA